MKFTSILKSVIVEQSRFELLYDALTKPSVDKKGEKQKPKLTKNEFFTLVGADPTTRLNDVDISSMNKEDFEKIKAGKYVQWLIKSFLNLKGDGEPGSDNYERELKQARDLFLEDLYKVTDDLKKFERFKNRLPKDKKDINKLTPDQLYDAVKDFDLTLATTTKSERKKATVHPGAKLIHDGDKWRVVEIEDKGEAGREAACFYGGNQKETRWCTSAPGLTWFDKYINEGPLYVIYNPNDTNVAPQTGLPIERYQFHFPSNQFMDKDDRKVDLVELLTGKMSELKNVFKKYFIEGITKQGEILDIESFSSGSVGTFIAIYGLNDLFENLPLGLKEFKIKNKDKNNIKIKIPESINKFKELHMILLDNCVDSVPDSICDLPNLRFLSLINNKDLRSIPDCVVNLPKLIFINLRGSDYVDVPEKIKEKGDDMGGGYWDMGLI
jgi:Leucine-rich repeat (LRR) protein